MSVRDLLAAYAVTLAPFVFGCLGIERSGIGLKGARWLKTAEEPVVTEQQNEMPRTNYP